MGQQVAIYGAISHLLWEKGDNLWCVTSLDMGDHGVGVGRPLIPIGHLLWDGSLVTIYGTFMGLIQLGIVENLAALV